MAMLAIGQVKTERPSPQRTPRSTEENGGEPLATGSALISTDFKIKAEK
jgi:hypothetical protein